MKKHVITIAGRPGSGKSSTAKAVTTRLGYQHFSSGDLFRALAKERGNDVLGANLSAEHDSEIDRLVDTRLQEIGATEDQLVVDSRTAWHWMPDSFKVFLDLDLETAAERILSKSDEKSMRLGTEHLHDDPKEYTHILEQRLESEIRRYKSLYDINPYDMSNYDLVVDTATNSLDKTVEMVLQGFQDWIKTS